MKTKLMIFALLFAATTMFVGCDKGEGEQTADAIERMVVKLPTNINTRAIENTTLDANDVETTISDVHVFLMNGLSVFKYETFTAAELTAKEKVFENVSSLVNNVIVVANVPAGDDISELGNTNAIKSFPFTVASQQNGIENLTLIGEATVLDDGTDTGNKIAEIELKALTARFEIGAVKAGKGIKSIDIKGVFINSYYATNAKDAPVVNDSDSTMWNYTFVNGEHSATPQIDFTETYSEPTYFEEGNAAVTVGGNSCYAFQVFAGDNIPQITLVVAGEYEEDYYYKDIPNDQYFVRYVTFKNYKKTTGSQDFITSIDAHKIYQIGTGASGIEIEPREMTTDPDPEEVNLTVEVSVKDWSIEEVTPSV